MKKILSMLICTLCTISLYSQRVNFSVQADGSFVNAETSKTYAILSIPRMSAEELYYAFLVTLRNKCVNNAVQIDVIENRAINIYDFESKLKIGGGMSAPFNGYVHYRLLLQFKDEQVKFEAPNVSHFVDDGTTPIRYQFETIINALQLFKEDGSPRKKNYIMTINDNINNEISEIIDAALEVYKW